MGKVSDFKDIGFGHPDQIVCASDSITHGILGSGTFTYNNCTIRVCDGTADNVEVQAALNAIALSVYGGIVQLSSGLFNIADTVYIPNQNYISLVGEGPTATTLFLVANTNKAMIAKDTPATTKYRSRISNIGLEGNSTNNATGTYGINCTGMEALLVENVRIYDTKSHGFYANAVNGVILRNTRAVSCKGAGYYLANIAGWVFDTVFSNFNSSYGFTIQSGWECFGVNISCDQDLGDAFGLSSVARSSFKNLWVAPVTQYKYGLSLYSCVDTTIDGGSFYPPVGASASTRGVVFSVNNTRVNIQNFSFDGSAASLNDCIRESGTASINCYVDNCRFSGFTSVLGMVINGVSFKNNSGYIAPGERRVKAYSLTKTGTCTLTNGSGTATGSPIALKPALNNIDVTGLGTFTIVLPTGWTGTAESDVCTVNGSPVALVAGSNVITTSGVVGNIKVTINAYQAVQCPEAQNCLIEKVVLDIVTPGGTATSVLQVGTADDAVGTNLGSEIFTGADLNTAAILDSAVAGDTGAMTKPIPWNATGTDDYVIFKINTEVANALMGTYKIFYMGRG